MLVTEAVTGLSHLTREIGIGLKSADAGAQGVGGVHLLILRVVNRTPTLVVPESAYHRVGGFDFRTWLLRPEARKAGTEIEFERRGDDEGRLRCEHFAGAIDARLVV